MELKFDKKKIFIILLVAIIMAMVFKNNFQRSSYIVSPDESGKSEDEIAQVKEEDIPEMDFDRPDDHGAIDDYIKVYVSGEVENYGVIEIKSDSRLVDAVEKLGGLTREADINRVNLAQKLKDGAHYIIPKKGEHADYEGTTAQGDLNSSTRGNNNELEDGKIDINSAGEIELRSLPGIGEVISERIVEYRKQNGKFKSTSELKNVPGIGDKKFESIQEMIRAD